MPIPKQPPRPTQLQGITDLTVFADIKQGLIDGIFESRSYAWRLQRVLELLDAARRGYRESDTAPNPFIDGVARLRGVHFFRFGVLPAVDVVEKDGKTVRRQKLYLNVTFDGGWEPYLRAIWGQLGTMLDLIFCHCEDYPLAATQSFEEYARWVRSHEAPSQFFYADSAGTAADRPYLDRLDRQQREEGGLADPDRRAAQLALKDFVPPEASPPAILGALRTLRGLSGLLQFFGLPAKPNDDGAVLLRFAQDFLPDLRKWVEEGKFDPASLPPERQRELAWLMLPHWKRPERRDHLTLTPELLQAGILAPLKAPDEKVTRGALVLARVVAGRAAGVYDWLKTGGVISNGSTVTLAPNKIVCTVAITYAGLRALGVHERRLASLPAEFTQGMEGRAGILGDVRMNHPLEWNRPRAGAGSPRLDLSMVHLVIQLRTSEADGEKSDDPSPLLKRLDDAIKALPGAIQVLAVEPAWSRPSVGDEPASRDHFNYVDGVSQPVLPRSDGHTHWNNTVPTGELLLGWMNDRGDGPLAMAGGGVMPVSPPWLDLGTFLVIRKIRQHVDHFDRIVGKTAGELVKASGMSDEDATELVRAKLMGRGSDGTPLVEKRKGHNDFNFTDDKFGDQCPFASHVRRANPRAETAGLRPPRIVRRGMSYGPPGSDEKERGVLFLAYNASIAEQFEVIQRWLTGGNSSGVSSAQPDPICGVPRLDEPTVFRFTHGKDVVRVNFGQQAICKLEWGLYAFVPPMALLKDLAQLTTDPGEDPPKAETPEDPAEEKHKKRIKAEFEDDNRRQDGWERVRGRSTRVEKIDTTVMVGGYDAVMNVLKDSGKTYSVEGYGERMGDTLGASPFGQNDDGPKSGHERAFVGDVKAAIAAAVSEKSAYDLSFQFTSKNLADQLAKAKAIDLPGAGVDIVELGAALIAELLKEWFGVVYDGQVAEAGLVADQARPVRCPAHFLSVSRKVFSAYPNDTVEARAAAHGAALKEAVEKWVAAAPAAASAPVMKAVLNAIESPQSGQGIDSKEKNGTVANIMLGLPGTLLGSWSKVVVALSVSRGLWRLQYGLLGVDPKKHEDVRKVLYQPLILAMAANPVADGIWRKAAQAATIKDATGAADVTVAKGDIVWLGLGAALADKPGDVQAAEDLLFGGTWKAGSDRDTPHACPGRGLAIGALLGALTALLLAGDWAVTPSPTVLELKPPKA